MAAPPSVPSHVTENIETIAQLHAVHGAQVSRHQRAIETLTRRLGRPRTLYIMVAVVGMWAAYNGVSMWTRWPVFDRPPFYALQGVLTLYAAIVATTVLTAQNRLNREAERRSHLELQVSLLAEQKATKIISLIEELRRDSPDVPNRRDTVAEAMQLRANPAAVLSAFESTLESTIENGQSRSTSDEERIGPASSNKPSASALGVRGEGSK